MSSLPKLYYVYDPMCSWCWGYKPIWTELEKQLNNQFDIIYVLGGLAPDSDTPMPEEMQKQIALYWKKIEDYLGTQFNYQFWQENTPRRSTYPSCRAIIAARNQGAEKEMLTAIQHGYYLEARNPSDNEILITLAQEIDLDTHRFTQDLLSEETDQALMKEISFARSIGGNSFPSLFIENNDTITEFPINYQDAQITVNQMKTAIQ